MANSVKPIPDGQNAITPHLVVKGASEAIDFYKQALGAVEICRMPGPDGRLMHAAVQIGDSKLFLCDECPEYGTNGPNGSGRAPVTIHLYVEDADATVERAVEAGATVTMPLTDMFWGDRYGQFVDPFGHQWAVATHIEDLTVEQMMERAGAAFAGAPA